MIKIDGVFIVISIIDCGLGNVGSVIRMIEKVGGSATRVSSAEQIYQAKKLMLPGVGHFSHGMDLLEKYDLLSAIQQKVSTGAPLLGICLGMQLLFDSSEEGNCKGLGLIPGKVVAFERNSGLKVPHMGWNEVDVRKENPLISHFDEAGRKNRFYFVHSFHAVCQNLTDVLATTPYGTDITSAVSSGNIFGAQFHPEKSHKFGMSLMKKFVEL